MPKLGYHSQSERRGTLTASDELRDEAKRLRARVRELEARLESEGGQTPSEPSRPRGRRNDRSGSASPESPAGDMMGLFRDSAQAYVEAAQRMTDAMFSFADAVLRPGDGADSRRACFTMDLIRGGRSTRD